jgi:hypothetical protein
MLLDQGSFDEAESHFRDLIPRAESALPPGHVNLALYRGSYGLLLLRAERWREAEEMILAAQRGLEAALGRDHPRVRTQIERLISLYEGWGHEASAAQWRERLAAEG